MLLGILGILIIVLMKQLGTLKMILRAGIKTHMTLQIYSKTIGIIMEDYLENIRLMVYFQTTRSIWNYMTIQILIISGELILLIMEQHQNGIMQRGILRMRLLELLEQVLFLLIR